MLKTYTLKQKSYGRVSANKGTVRYILQEEDGSERTVMAMTELGLTKKVKAIRPMFHRESPLIDKLALAEVNDRIWVDFSDFNHKTPRASSAKKRGEAKKIIKELNHTSASMSRVFAVDMYRILQLFIISSLGFLGFLIIF